ncbi:hypothetical protein pb186bvf_009044 [Paramecium bursaria]
MNKNNKSIKAYELLSKSINKIVIQQYEPSKENQDKDIIMIKQQIQKYLKDQYTKSNYSRILRSQLKQLIMSGELHEMNYNWVILELSGARTRKYQNQGLYDEILKLKQNYPDSFFQNIKQDVPRTSAQQNKLHEQRIENILVAYAIRNPFVGYCQGLNFVVHFLANHLKFSEEDTFWIISCLIESIMPLDYYTNMLSVIVDAKILDYYTKIFVPQLNAHFKEIYLETNFYSIQWFVCLFTPNLNLDIVKEIWLRVMVHGSKALMISSVVILYLFQQELLRFYDFAELLEFFKDRLKQYNNINEFRYYFNQIIIDKKSLDESRYILRKAVQAEQEQNINNNLIEKVLCNTQWTICNQVIQVNRALKRSFSFFVYSQQDKCMIINDYWDQKTKQQNMNTNILLGRQFHICDQSQSQDIIFKSTILITTEPQQETKSQSESSETSEDVESRPRSSAVHRYLPHLDQQGYDGFYQQARYLMTQQKRNTSVDLEPKQQEKQDRLAKARQSLVTLQFASHFID